MQNVGLAVVGIGMAANTCAGASRSDKDGFAEWANKAIKAPEKEVFYAVNRRYTTIVSMAKSDFVDLMESSGVLNANAMSICTNKEKTEGFVAAEGFLLFQPLKAVGVCVGEVETDRCIAILSLAFRETEVRVWKDGWAHHQLKGWNSICIPEENEAIDVEIYKKVDLGEILDENWIWTEIKE